MKRNAALIKSFLVASATALQMVAAVAREPFQDDYVIGHALSDSKKEKESIVWLTKAIKNKHNLLNAYVMRAHCYLIERKFVPALSDCNAALKISPQCRWALHQRITANIFLKNYADAIRDAKLCIEIDKQDDQAYAECVKLYTWLGKKDLAAELRTIAPGHLVNLHPFMKQAKWFEDHDQFREAAQEYSKCLQMFPTYVRALRLRAKCHIALGFTDKALEDLSKAIELWPDATSCCANAPDEIESLRLRAKTYLSMGKLVEAKNDYSSLLLIDPGSDTDYFGRADIEVKLKEYDQAISDYSNVILFHPQDEDAYRSRARTYFAIGRNDKAIEDYTTTIKLDPDIAESYEGRGHAYERLGKHDLAQADLARAKELKAKTVHD